MTDSEGRGTGASQVRNGSAEQVGSLREKENGLYNHLIAFTFTLSENPSTPEPKRSFLPRGESKKIMESSSTTLANTDDREALEHVEMEEENPFASIVSSQKIAIVPEFKLESGTVLKRAPVAYKTWGTLNSEGTNVMILCHALSGSADVEDWWQTLIGPKRAFDTEKFFIFCGNALGSPYGSASPMTLNPATGNRYGPDFPLTTVRDDVRIHRRVLSSLGVKQIAYAIGGSMGGMHVLEWAAMGTDYVKNFVPIATSGRHSAWCISWGEAQRQAIYSDPKYRTFVC